MYLKKCGYSFSPAIVRIVETDEFGGGTFEIVYSFSYPYDKYSYVYRTSKPWDYCSNDLRKANKLELLRMKIGMWIATLKERFKK